MDNPIFVPGSLRTAGRDIRHAVINPIELLPRTEFLRAWSSLAYLFPGLHPDDIAEPDNGLPRGLLRFVAEAWRRADLGELTEHELYPSDAQWAGLYDRMPTHTAEETERRLKLAADFGDRAHA
jgi:hypothetical protein